MIFPTLEFALFFFVVFLVNWAIRRHTATWKVFMLAASYFFYGYWDWRFIALLAGSSVLNHAVARGLDRSTSRPIRISLLTLAITFNLGSIGFFKYTPFLVEQAIWVNLKLTGGEMAEWWWPVLDFTSYIILPVGISFFTFQALSYVGDVYRGKMKPADSLLDFALYLAFFPQLVAGPIVRAAHLVGQLARPYIPAQIDVGRAACLILGGLFKKIVIANYLGVHIVDPVFGNPEAYGAVDTLFAVYAYAIQIYCDFSAYSDMAIGFCLLLGFHIPINFNAPYLAGSIQHFWRRWHISLSSFLRDYLYIPLGGSRKGGEGTVYRNLFITFLLGGLWHGAGWTFIAWGALHGAYLSIERALGKLMDRLGIAFQGGIARVIRCLLVWHLVCLSWLFFRCHTFADAMTMLRSLGDWSVPVQSLTWPIGIIIVVGYASQLLDGSRMEKVWDAYTRLHPVLQGAAAAVVLTMILGLGPQGVAPFIYFDF
jgi:alginate O-acetyltransferase complex protein AlgI